MINICKPVFLLGNLISFINAEHSTDLRRRLRISKESGGETETSVLNWTRLFWIPSETLMMGTPTHFRKLFSSTNLLVSVKLPKKYNSEVFLKHERENNLESHHVLQEPLTWEISSLNVLTQNINMLELWNPLNCLTNSFESFASQTRQILKIKPVNQRRFSHVQWS